MGDGQMFKPVMLGSGRDKHRLEKNKGLRFLKGVFKSKGCWGLPRQLLATIGCIGSSRTKGMKEHALKSST